jgi:DNA-binding winged helix-turn-helix (wHTH) protein
LAEDSKTKGKTLAEALVAWGDPAAVAEMLSLAEEGYDSPLMIIILGAPPSEYERKTFRYQKLREGLEAAFLAKLRDGPLVTMGYVHGSSVNEPPVIILSDRWRVLTPNYEDSSATGAGMTVSGILVYEDESAAGVPARPAPPRLRMSRDPRRARLDDTELQLTPRSLRLLLVLAEAVVAGRSVVSRQDIERQLWAAPVGKKAVADAVHKLKCELVDQDVVEAAAYLLIENYLATGYRLAVAASEIQVTD